MPKRDPSFHISLIPLLLILSVSSGYPCLSQTFFFPLYICPSVKRWSTQLIHPCRHFVSNPISRFYSLILARMAPLQIIGRILLLTLLLTRAQSESAATSVSATINLAPPPAPIAPTAAILKSLEGSCRYHPGGGSCPEHAPCCLNGYCSGTNYGPSRRAVGLLLGVDWL